MRTATVATILGSVGLLAATVSADTVYTFTQIDVPGATLTNAFGINNAGHIVGIFGNSTGIHGFVDSGGTLTQIDVPGFPSTCAMDINDPGEIVGCFAPSSGCSTGFLYSGGSFTQIHGPSSPPNPTVLTGINNAGQIVGYTGGPSFIDIGGMFTQIAVPGSIATDVYGINNAGQIVGFFVNSTGTHGFLDSGGTFTQIDVPGATSTTAYGINDNGEIVGLTGPFTDIIGSHGFIATPA